MPDTPTFGRYAEIPYDQMTPEQPEGYRSRPASSSVSCISPVIYRLHSISKIPQ